MNSIRSKLRIRIQVVFLRAYPDPVFRSDIFSGSIPSGSANLVITIIMASTDMGTLLILTFKYSEVKRANYTSFGSESMLI